MAIFQASHRRIAAASTFRTVSAGGQLSNSAPSPRPTAAAILLWLAWKIANAAPPREREAEGRPLTYLEATAFQWVNPKAWFMAIGAMSAYAATGGAPRVLAVAGVFLAFGLCSALTWTTAGTQLRRVLTSPARLRAFNWTMAALLVASLIPMLRA